MNFYDYILETRKTAIYPREKALDYVTLGLIGEVGELANKAKKILRDDQGVVTDERREALIDELGDVLWYTARFVDERGTADEYYLFNRQMNVRTLIDDLLSLCRCASRFLLDSDSTYGNPAWILFWSTMVASHLGTDLNVVMDQNIAKLASRQERGTLHGSGDAR